MLIRVLRIKTFKVQFSTTSHPRAECSAVGSALRSGRRGRAFESPHSDRKRQTSKIGCRFFFFTSASLCKSTENLKNFILAYCSITKTTIPYSSTIILSTQDFKLFTISLPLILNDFMPKSFNLSSINLSLFLLEVLV